MKRLAIVFTLCFAGLPCMAQSAGTPAGGKVSQSAGFQRGNGSARKNKGKTADPGPNPTGGPGDQASRNETDGNEANQSRTPPNPPIVDPHENPVSPTNAPKKDNLPKQGNGPDK